VDEALEWIDFRFAVTDDQFASIAKLRAARKLWARIAELSRGEGGASADSAPRGQRQHAVTSAAMLTQRDPWVNLLRTTVACFAAAVGGAEAITVLPFDNAVGLPDQFARRIARNTQSILRAESAIGRVLDPAGGSWYVESLTDQLAQAAWDIFTAVERSGGAAAALGQMAEQIAQVQAERAADIAHRKAPITGVSEFALVTEERLTRPAAPAVQPETAPATKPLVPHRYAEAFEALRDRTDAAPERPKVFIAALGPFAAHSARLGFTTNLLNAAGIDSVVGTGDSAELVGAFAGSGTPVAVIAGSDRSYGEQASDTAAALHAAGASYVWLAGKGDVFSGYGAVNGYLYLGADVLDILTTTLDLLEVPA
jgi:methylmalonyl-CoA mutase